jgi:hypothetical protein
MAQTILMGNEFGFANNNEVVVHELSQTRQQVLLELFSLPSDYEAISPPNGTQLIHHTRYK